MVRSRVVARVSLVVVSLLTCARALALDPQPRVEPGRAHEEVAPAPAEAPSPWMLQRKSWSYDVGLSAELGVLPAGQIGRERNIAGGISGFLLAAPPEWPFYFGGGAGNLWLETSTQRGPEVRLRDETLPWRTTTTVERSLEVRHLEGIVRVQPYLGRVRPYLEGFFGLGVLWQGADLEDDDGNVIAKQERQRRATWIGGGTLGLQIPFSDPARGGSGCLTLGTRWLRTGDLNRIKFSDQTGTYQIATTGRAHLSMWMPFIALSFAL